MTAREPVVAGRRYRLTSDNYLNVLVGTVFEAVRPIAASEAKVLVGQREGSWTWWLFRRGVEEGFTFRDCDVEAVAGNAKVTRVSTEGDLYAIDVMADGWTADDSEYRFCIDLAAGWPHLRETLPLAKVGDRATIELVSHPQGAGYWLAALHVESASEPDRASDESRLRAISRALDGSRAVRDSVSGFERLVRLIADGDGRVGGLGEETVYQIGNLRRECRRALDALNDVADLLGVRQPEGGEAGR